MDNNQLNEKILDLLLKKVRVISTEIIKIEEILTNEKNKAEMTYAEIKSEPVLVGELPRSWRQRHLMPLSDQCHNPGALNYGPRAKRFGSKAWYEGTKGNRTAYFDDWEDGLTALLDRILRDEGKTITDYILGGFEIEPADSYSGGQDYNNYLQIFGRYFSASTRIKREVDFLYSMVLAHCIGEGTKMRFSKDDISVAMSSPLLSRFT